MVIGDLSEQEEKKVGEEEEEDEVHVKEKRLERLLKAIKKDGSKVKIELPIYSESLNGEELLDWIGELDKYFKLEEIPKGKQVK